MTRTVVVTGGCSGIGLAVAELLASSGDRVIKVDVDPAADVVLDVTNADGVQALVDEFADVTVLVNSAGIVGPAKPLWEYTTPEWQAVFSVNVVGTFNMCRAFVPTMRRAGWGRIVNFASMAGKDGNPNMSAYSASKAAVIALTKSLGKELAADNVLVNVIAPAVIATPMNSKTSPEVLAQITKLIPMGRVGRPEEVAELVAWLASTRCSFSTGAVYDISGGRATY